MHQYQQWLQRVGMHAGARPPVDMRRISVRSTSCAALLKMPPCAPVMFFCCTSAVRE